MNVHIMKKCHKVKFMMAQHCSTVNEGDDASADWHVTKGLEYRREKALG